MKLSTKIQLLLIGIIGIGIYGCIKVKSVPVIPSIAFKDFVKYTKDSADIIFTFKDGDGDIGLIDSDTLPPHNVNGKNYFDLIIEYYYKGADGKFHRYKDPSASDSLMWGYRIPYITPIGQNKLLEGEIRYNFQGAPYYAINVNSGAALHKIIHFEVYMYDRALHKSNVIVTPEITIP